MLRIRDYLNTGTSEALKEYIVFRVFRIRDYLNTVASEVLVPCEVFIFSFNIIETFAGSESLNSFEVILKLVYSS